MSDTSAMGVLALICGAAALGLGGYFFYQQQTGTLQGSEGKDGDDGNDGDDGVLHTYYDHDSSITVYQLTSEVYYELSINFTISELGERAYYCYTGYAWTDGNYNTRLDFQFVRDSSLISNLWTSVSTVDVDDSDDWRTSISLQYLDTSLTPGDYYLSIFISESLNEATSYVYQNVLFIQIYAPE